MKIAIPNFEFHYQLVLDSIGVVIFCIYNKNNRGNRLALKAFYV